MKDVVEVEINRPRAQAAELLADPANSPKWMDDLERWEPISGERGMPGSKYRLVPKKGDMIFEATVIARDLPDDLRLTLQASNVTVSVTSRLIAISAQKTRLVSEEVFRFQGFMPKLLGLFAGPAIRKVHRRHMEAFKRFAESSSAEGASRSAG